MVRSESADEDVTMMEKYDDELEEDFSPQSRWNSQTGNGIMGHRPDSRTASSLSPTSGDPDRRLRRQIANCNERRRMQSINAGFQSLRALLPKKEGEKLSKAAILQQTADLIHQLQGERHRLMMLDREGAGGKKPKLDDFSEVDQRAMIDRLQLALERERTSRMYLEQQLGQMREQIVTQQHHHQQQGMSPASPSCTVPSVMSTGSAVNGQMKHEASVIRPTPLPPISVDVSSSRVATHLAPLPSSASPLPPPASLSSLATPLAISSAPSAFTTSSSISAHRSLQTILDAIRHLEGGAMAAHSPPPTSQAPLVR